MGQGKQNGFFLLFPFGLYDVVRIRSTVCESSVSVVVSHHIVDNSCFVRWQEGRYSAYLLHLVVYK